MKATGAGGILSPFIDSLILSGASSNSSLHVGSVHSLGSCVWCLGTSWSCCLVFLVEVISCWGSSHSWSPFHFLHFASFLLIALLVNSRRLLSSTFDILYLHAGSVCCLASCAWFVVRLVSFVRCIVALLLVGALTTCHN
jgi:hypothetical protein